jgi:hypothetical protein
MHFNFTTLEVLWTLTVAALLVLLVVLLGRDRVRSFPWFTASTALVVLRLLASRELYGRLSPLTLSAIFNVLADLGAAVGIMVLVEMARRAFVGLHRHLWIVNTAGLVVAACGVLAVWGPWPTWKTLTADSQLAALRLMELFAQKTEVVSDLLSVGLGLAVVLVGRRYKAGWHSHVQRIVIGLAAVAIAKLSVQVVLERIALTAAPHNQAELDAILGLRDKIINANSVVFIAVVVWWIVCLWIDEPGAAAEQNAGAAGKNSAL